MTRHFINLNDFEAGTLKSILKNAHALKAQKFNPPQLFSGLSLAMMFDKLSTRTRVSFDVAMKQLGGHSIVMSKGEMQLGGAESIESTAKVMSRFVDAIMVRMSDHKMMEELASFATVPVINGMSDISHPCQIIADIMTIEEKLGSIEGKKVAWFGDYNNVTQSFVDAAALFNFELVLALPEDITNLPPIATLSPPNKKSDPSFTPPSKQGDPSFTPPNKKSDPSFTPPNKQGDPSFTPPSKQGDPSFTPPRKRGGFRGGVLITQDPVEAAKDADVLVTDTWVSLGQDGKEIEKFRPYQVNDDLMSKAKETAIFMHCLPIHEWEEVTENVAKSPASVVYDEAENRLHAQKAILAWCLEEAGVAV